MSHVNRGPLVDGLSRQNAQHDAPGAITGKRKRSPGTSDAVRSRINRHVEYNDAWDEYLQRKRVALEDDEGRPTTIDPRRVFFDADVRLAALAQEAAMWANLRGEVTQSLDGETADERTSEENVEDVNARSRLPMVVSTSARKPEESHKGDYLPEVDGPRRCHRPDCRLIVGSIREHLLQHVLDDPVYVCDGGISESFCPQHYTGTNLSPIVPAPGGVRRQGCGTFYTRNDRLGDHVKQAKSPECYSEFRRPTRLSEFASVNPYNISMEVFESRVAYYLRNELHRQKNSDGQQSGL
jgi:hypothetical protein